MKFFGYDREIMEKVVENVTYDWHFGGPFKPTYSQMKKRYKDFQVLNA